MYGPIAIMNKRKKNSGKKNPIQEFQEEKEIGLEEQVEWLGKFWVLKVNPLRKIYYNVEM